MTQKQPIVLTTDFAPIQHQAGISHFTPYVFTASHEYTMLSAFLGNHAFDPINYPVSPQKRGYDPADKTNSFFVLPKNGVQPEIDPATTV
eukprot:UN07779